MCASAKSGLSASACVERDRGRLRPAGRRECFAQAVVANGDIGPDLGSLAEMRHGLVEQTALHGDHAEKMQAAGVLGVAPEHGPAERLGIEGPAELVLPDGLGKQVRNRQPRPATCRRPHCAWLRRGALFDSSNARPATS